LDRVSIFTQENIQHNYGPDATLSNSFFKIVVNQINQNLRFFLQSGDRSSFYFANIPAFDSISAFFFWMGLGLIFTRPRRLPELTMIVWFVLGIFFGGVITNDAPSGSRLILTACILFVISGVFIQRTWDAINNTYKQLPNIHLSLGWLISPIILAALALTLYLNYNYNFVIYPKAGINILSISLTKEINAIAPMNHIYLFGIGEQYSTHGTIKFLAGDKKVIDITKLEELPPEADDGKGVTVLITSSHFEQAAELLSLYPQGKMSDEYRDGYLEFKKFQIPPLK
jgi:hypothetical protein